MSTTPLASEIVDKAEGLREAISAFLSKSIHVEDAGHDVFDFSAVLDKLDPQNVLDQVAVGLQEHAAFAGEVVADIATLIGSLQDEVHSFAGILQGGALPTQDEVSAFHHGVETAFETFFSHLASDYQSADFWL